MRDLDSAKSIARRMAKRTKKEHFVVYERDEFDSGNVYFVADEYDLDGFYAGSEVVYSTDDID